MSYRLFKKVMPRTLNLEGGFYNNPKDSGGATMFGIAFNKNKEILKTYGIFVPGQITNLTKEQAFEIYYQKYFLEIKADLFQSFEEFTWIYFDCAVNQGTHRAKKLLQMMLNDLNTGEFQDLVIDGKIGSKTIRVIEEVFRPLDRNNSRNFDKSLSEDVFIDIFKSKRTEVYTKIYRKISNKSFLNSWQKRI